VQKWSCRQPNRHGKEKRWDKKFGELRNCYIAQLHALNDGGEEKDVVVGGFQ